MLNHAIAVNKLLGYENRVAMTNRLNHQPTVESNEAIYEFFEHFLIDAKYRERRGNRRYDAAETSWLAATRSGAAWRQLREY